LDIKEVDRRKCGTRGSLDWLQEDGGQVDLRGADYGGVASVRLVWMKGGRSGGEEAIRTAVSEFQ
jgi:hypothetical protein